MYRSSWLLYYHSFCFIKSLQSTNFDKNICECSVLSNNISFLTVSSKLTHYSILNYFNTGSFVSTFMQLVTSFNIKYTAPAHNIEHVEKRQHVEVLPTFSHYARYNDKLLLFTARLKCSN